MYLLNTYQIRLINTDYYIIFDCLIFKLDIQYLELLLSVNEYKQLNLNGNILINDRQISINTSIDDSTKEDTVTQVSIINRLNQSSNLTGDSRLNQSSNLTGDSRLNQSSNLTGDSRLNQSSNPLQVISVKESVNNELYHRDLISKESYAHEYAKSCVCNWLRSKEHQAKYYQNKQAVFGHLNWSINTLNANNILVEYPILKYKDNYQGLTVWSTYPNLKLAKQNGREVFVIFDIVILSEGKLKYAIEINHKHPISKVKQQKIDELKKVCPDFSDCYELSATWVLDQICVPSKIDWQGN